LLGLDGYGVFNQMTTNKPEHAPCSPSCPSSPPAPPPVCRQRLLKGVVLLPPQHALRHGLGVGGGCGAARRRHAPRVGHPQHCRLQHSRLLDVDALGQVNAGQGAAAIHATPAAPAHAAATIVLVVVVVVKRGPRRKAAVAAAAAAPERVAAAGAAAAAGRHAPAARRRRRSHVIHHVCVESRGGVWGVEGCEGRWLGGEDWRREQKGKLVPTSWQPRPPSSLRPHLRPGSSPPPCAPPAPPPAPLPGSSAPRPPRRHHHRPPRPARRRRRGSGVVGGVRGWGMSRVR
jgi:hypothetical protein